MLSISIDRLSISIDRYCDICDKYIKGEYYKIRHISYKSKWKPIWIDICGKCMNEVLEAKKRADMRGDTV